MPSYEYQCSSKQCTEEKTILCKMSEYKNEILCEKCLAIMRRKPEGLVAGYQVNCSGFYGKHS